jgi:hypothetical protein
MPVAGVLYLSAVLVFCVRGLHQRRAAVTRLGIKEQPAAAAAEAAAASEDAAVPAATA